MCFISFLKRGVKYVVSVFEIIINQLKMSDSFLTVCNISGLILSNRFALFVATMFVIV